MKRDLFVTLLCLSCVTVPAFAQESQQPNYHYNDVYDYYNDTDPVKPFHVDSLLTTAKKNIGVAYVSPGRSPQKGFDCSGFTFYCFKLYGIVLPYTAHQQAEIGKEIPLTKVKPGDLIFFQGSNLSDKSVHHVGIATSSYSSKKGQSVNFIHAASHGVKVESLTSTYYKSRILKIRRVQ